MAADGVPTLMIVISPTEGVQSCNISDSALTTRSITVPRSLWMQVCSEVGLEANTTPLSESGDAGRTGFPAV